MSAYRGAGKCDDSSPGDIYSNERVCTTCSGSGFKPGNNRSEMEYLHNLCKCLREELQKDMAVTLSLQERLVKALEVIYHIKTTQDSYDTESETLAEIYLMCEAALNEIKP